MNKVWVILTLLLISFSACDAQNRVLQPDWKELVSEEGKFKATFPGTPKTSVDKIVAETEKTPNGSFEVQLPQRWFGISYQDSSKSLERDQVKARYDYLRDETLKLPNTKLVTEREISLSGSLGREIVITLNKTIITNRMYLIGNRLFQITTTISPPLTEDKEVKKDSDRFLDSFQLTENVANKLK